MAEQVILFDGVCNVCNSYINFVIRHDRKQKFKFASFTSDYGKNQLSKLPCPNPNPDTIYLISGQKILAKSDAILEITKSLDFGRFFFYFLMMFPRGIRNFGYEMFARNRYRILGKEGTCKMPPPDRSKRFYT